MNKKNAKLMKDVEARHAEYAQKNLENPEFKEALHCYDRPTIKSVTIQYFEPLISLWKWIRRS